MQEFLGGGAVQPLPTQNNNGLSLIKFNESSLDRIGGEPKNNGLRERGCFTKPSPSPSNLESRR